LDNIAQAMTQPVRDQPQKVGLSYYSITKEAEITNSSQHYPPQWVSLIAGGVAGGAEAAVTVSYIYIYSAVTDSSV
jgi:hypothetical protein